MKKKSERAERLRHWKEMAVGVIVGLTVIALVVSCAPRTSQVFPGGTETRLPVAAYYSPTVPATPVPTLESTPTQQPTRIKVLPPTVTPTPAGNDCEEVVKAKGELAMVTTSSGEIWWNWFLGYCQTLGYSEASLRSGIIANAIGNRSYGQILDDVNRDGAFGTGRWYGGGVLVQTSTELITTRMGAQKAFDGTMEIKRRIAQNTGRVYVAQTAVTGPSAEVAREQRIYNQMIVDGALTGSYTAVTMNIPVGADGIVLPEYFGIVGGARDTTHLRADVLDRELFMKWVWMARGTSGR